MPAHEVSKNERDALAKANRLLLALVRRENGEIRIRAADIDSINDRAVLMRDWDPATGEIVLRSGSQFAEFLLVEPEAAQWTRPVSERKEQLNTEPARTTVMTDAQVAEIEAGLLRRAAQRQRTRQATEQTEPSKPRVS